MFKRFNCKFCDEQFLNNERRWKLFTIPVFSVVSAFALTDYPIEIPKFFLDLTYITAIIFLLWISNRYLIIKFQKKCQNGQNKKKKLFIRYLSTTIVSMIIIIPAKEFYHLIDINEFPSGPCVDGHAHRMLYMITVLFVYFINANYERLFLFMDLSVKALEAEKYKKDSIEARFNNLKNKMNPHFLFNTFNALSEIIDEDPPKATKLVQEMSDVYRYVLDNQEMNWVILSKETQFAYSYTNLLKMRFEDNLNINIDIPDDKLDWHIVPLSMQIVLENVVKHNEISSKRKLNVSIQVEDDWIVVKNNLQEKETFGNGTSFGLSNLTERYQYLSGKKIIILKTSSDFIVKLPLINKL